MVTKGTTVITATDARNSLHYDESEASPVVMMQMLSWLQVHVIPADTMSFIPSVVMVMVGHVIRLPVKIGVHIGGCLLLFSCYYSN